LETDADRIIRLWAKRLRVEVHEVECTGRDLKEGLALYVRELGRLLRDRGKEALTLWPEVVRAHGARRYEQHFEMEDLARELKALQWVLVTVYARRYGQLEPEVAAFIGELVGEAIAASGESFARALRTEEVRFREAAVMESILHHVEMGILLAEMDGSLSYATPPVARLLGVPVRALLGGRGVAPLAAVLTELQARHLDGAPFKVQDMPFVRATHERRGVRGVGMVIERPTDGQEVILEMSATPIWDDDPERSMWGVIQTLADRSVTAQKTRELSEAYEELRKLQARLMQRTRSQALGQLASGAAHNLNNFLNVLRLRITLLKKDMKASHLDALDRTVNNIGELVARLQDFATHRTEDELADVQVAQVVREALELAGPELSRGEPPVRVEIELSGAAKVQVDRGLLRELVVNMLLAARARVPDGWALRLLTGQREGWVELHLADSGAPFSDEELSHLFDPLKGKSNAPQLALLRALARSQVQRWGGELECHNLENGQPGAECVVRLPISRADEPSPKAEPRRQRRPRVQTRTVLVVDDDFDNARMMAAVLSEEGYHVRVAHSGKEAVALWERQIYDAALLDALMPDMSGWELARQIRARSPRALIGMVTGADVRGQNRSNLALVDGVFRKPIDVAALDDFLSQSAQGPEPAEPHQVQA
jgi:CheY-like chemotaxis protein